MNAFTLPIFRSTSLISTKFSEFPVELCFDLIIDMHEKISIFQTWFTEVSTEITEIYKILNAKYNLHLLEIENHIDFQGKMFEYCNKKIFRLNKHNENPHNKCLGFPLPKDWNPQYNWRGWLHNTCKNYIMSAFRKYAKAKEREHSIELYEKSKSYTTKHLQKALYQNHTDVVELENMEFLRKEMLLYITNSLMEMEGNKNTSNFVYKFVNLHSTLSDKDIQYLHPTYDLPQITKIRTYIYENEDYLEHDFGAKEETSHNLKKLAFLLHGKNMQQHVYLESTAAKTDINTLTKQKNRQGDIIERYLLLSLILLPCPSDMEIWVWNKSKVGLAKSLGVDVAEIENIPTQSDNYLQMVISYVFNIVPTQKTVQHKRLFMWKELSNRLQRYFRKIV